MNSLRYVGLDVHKETIAVAVAEEGRDAPKFVGTIRNEPAAIRKLIRELGSRARLRCCYEAGACGYVLYHQLAELAVNCTDTHRSQTSSCIPARAASGSRPGDPRALTLRSGPWPNARRYSESNADGSVSCGVASATRPAHISLIDCRDTAAPPSDNALVLGNRMELGLDKPSFHIRLGHEHSSAESGVPSTKPTEPAESRFIEFRHAEGR